MKKINKSIALFLIISSLFSTLYSCDSKTQNGKEGTETLSKNSTISNETNNKNEVDKTSKVVETKISEIIVTDEDGKSVTDENGKEVTEKVFIDEKGNAVTNIDKNPVSVNNGSKVTTPSKNENTVTDKNSTTSPTANDANNLSMQYARTVYLDMANIQKSITGDGNIAKVTFKVKENVPNGEYEIMIDSLEPEAIQFTNTEMENLPYKIQKSAIVSVGVPLKETVIPNTGDFSIYMNNATTNAGETFEMFIDIKNNPGFIVFVLDVAWDKSIFEIQSIEASGILPKNSLDSNLDIKYIH